MIDNALKQKIIETLGKQYSPKIIARLNSKGVLNSEGKPYSSKRIVNIVNAYDGTENETVENEILDLLAEKISAGKKKEQKRNRVLKQ